MISRSKSSKRIAFILTRSIIPVKSGPEPTGTWNGTALASRISFIPATAASKSAPSRSILLTKAMRGTRCRSAWFQTVSDCGSTPETAQKTAIIPSSTRSERSTSSVKSTWPGVSIRLTVWPFQAQEMAAEAMVIPRSCSCFMKSMVALPSWTSPMRVVVPVK